MLPSDPESPFPAALEAAVRAFASARSARILLDSPGRLGADAVTRTQAISGARRASQKAQAGIVESARRLEEARDRWGALMRGLAADLGVSPSELVPRVERSALELALTDAAALLRAASAAAASLAGGEAPRGLGQLQAMLTELSRQGGAGAAQPWDPPGGSESG